MTNKRLKLIVSIVAVAAIFVLAARFLKRPATVPAAIPKPVQNVTTQAAADSRSFTQSIEYPATIVGDQEIEVTAKSAGTAMIVNFALGSPVGIGSLLVKIDDSGNSQKSGESGFKSTDVQQSQISVEQAEEQLDLAKKTYKNLKDEYDYEKKNPTAPQTVTKTQKDSAKEAVDLAEIALKNAKVGYKGSLDSHLITSPISGFVTQKSVSAGDSVSVGQTLFKISKTKNVKIQFFVDEGQLPQISKGMEIKMTASDGNEIPVIIRNISPEADSATKRFLIEAFPKNPGVQNLISGTIVSVTFQIVIKPQKAGNFILPLSAINIGQNESYVFIAENGQAKKVDVNVVQVAGETAEISADLPSDAAIILNGSKIVQDGSEINITQ